MSKNISKLISEEFDTDLADKLGIYGSMKLIVAFKIDKEGKVFAVRSRAPHPGLAEEASRVIRLIPDMESPGYIDDHPVIIPYSIPLMFKVERQKRNGEKLKIQHKKRLPFGSLFYPKQYNLIIIQNTVLGSCEIVPLISICLVVVDI